MENDMKDDGVVIENMTDTDLIEFANKKVDGSVPKFKLKYFVGQSQITPFHHLKQLMLELRIRQDSFLHIEWEIKRKELEEAVEKIASHEKLTLLGFITSEPLSRKDELEPRIIELQKNT